MRKICEYCETEVEYKEENVTHDDYKGRGIYCRFCGGFIEIPRYTSIEDPLSSSYPIRERRGVKYRRKKNRQMVVIGIFLVIFVGLGFIFFLPPISVPEKKLHNSTFIILDNKTKSDISSEIKISIYVSKEDVEFERELDIVSLLNYDKVIDSVYANNVMVNLIPYLYAWIETNPNNENPNYNNDYGRLVNGINCDYVFYAYPPVNITSRIESIFERSRSD